MSTVTHMSVNVFISVLELAWDVFVVQNLNLLIEYFLGDGHTMFHLDTTHVKGGLCESSG